MSVGRFYDVMKQVNAIPYRVGGRVRVAHPVETSELAVEKMEKAVKVMAKHVSEKLPEPDGPTKVKWLNAGLKQLDVCDEVCPEGVSLTECPVEWLVGRCGRYHFDLVLSGDEPPKLKWALHTGWHMDDKEVRGGKVSGVKSIMPLWFVDACKHLGAWQAVGGGL